MKKIYQRPKISRWGVSKQHTLAMGVLLEKENIARKCLQNERMALEEEKVKMEKEREKLKKKQWILMQKPKSLQKRCKESNAENTKRISKDHSRLKRVKREW